jgi:hypothetical protein
LTPPVLLIIFKRPEHTRRALAAIRRVRPKILLVAADGPRDGDETVLCAQAREVIEGVDWDCTVLKNYSDRNLGCGVRVHTGIEWAFSKFEELIVLEDDCIPTGSFFSFCEELLAYYRDDERVMHIGGFNLQPTNPVTSHSYYFSKYTLASGAWATWRRAWRFYDAKLASWPAAKSEGVIESWCSDRYERSYWSEVFDRMYQGAPDVWDYQWNYACWTQNGLAILPSVPLATNVGFGAGATHTKSPIPGLMRAPGEIDRIDHPPFMVRNCEADAYVFENSFGGGAMKQADSSGARLRRRLGPILGPLRALKRIVGLAGRQRRSADA